jgi:hypothetical protein
MSPWEVLKISGRKRIAVAFARVFRQHPHRCTKPTDFFLTQCALSTSCVGSEVSDLPWRLLQKAAPFRRSVFFQAILMQIVKRHTQPILMKLRMVTSPRFRHLRYQTTIFCWRASHASASALLATRRALKPHGNPPKQV